MSDETPMQVIERLEALNHKLSMQIIGTQDRLQGFFLQVAQKAWDEGYTSGHSRAMRHMSDEPGVSRGVNPYCAMIAEKEAQE